VRKKLRPLGDTSCPKEVYVQFLGTKGTKPERAGRAWLYAPYVRQAAAHWGIPADLLMGLIHTESGFQPAVGSGAGAVGLTQYMPKTAVSRYGKLVEAGQWPFEPLVVNNDPMASTVFREAGVEGNLDRTDPFQAIWMGASGLRSKFDRGWDVEHALASYNAGEGRVKRDMPAHEWPQETQNYVPGVLRRSGYYRDLWSKQCALAA
jgi:soluble lytic murein transglycosylase-like protein